MVRAPYHAARRLVAVAQEHWEAFDGEAALRGGDPLSLPLPRFLNAIYAWCIARVKEPEAFREQVYRTPIRPGAKRRVSDEELAAERAEFAAFAAAFGMAPKPETTTTADASA